MIRYPVLFTALIFTVFCTANSYGEGYAESPNPATIPALIAGSARTPDHILTIQLVGVSTGTFQKKSIFAKPQEDQNFRKIFEDIFAQAGIEIKWKVPIAWSHASIHPDEINPFISSSSKSSEDKSAHRMGPKQGSESFFRLASQTHHYNKPRSIIQLYVIQNWPHTSKVPRNEICTAPPNSSIHGVVMSIDQRCTFGRIDGGQNRYVCMLVAARVAAAIAIQCGLHYTSKPALNPDKNLLVGRPSSSTFVPGMQVVRDKYGNPMIEDFPEVYARLSTKQINTLRGSAFVYAF